MLRTTQIDLEQAGVLNRLVTDYLRKEKNTRALYDFYPDDRGLKHFIEQTSFPKIDRPILTAVLRKQAARFTNTSEATLQNIEKLNDHTCYTVTTGHQVCLFTGPLYFIYKIYATINLARQLNAENPGKTFVPLYWMATEDHDFEEVNHFFVNGKKIRWQSAQTGAVGNFKTAELKNVLNHLKEALGISTHANYLVKLFENAYLKHADLSSATHFLVNELFGEEGLIVLDPNEKALKQQFNVEFEADLLGHKAELHLRKTADELEKAGYPVQVHARQINSFYLEEGLRARIEKTGSGFQVVGTGKHFSENEIRAMLEESPERFSPNVVLRPLFQQKILPNVAYVGGPGELAYWLEMAGMFREFGITFPVLVPRAFITVIDALTQQKTSQLKLELAAVFKSEQELLRVVQKDQGKIISFEKEEQQVSDLFNTLAGQLTAIDRTLEKAVRAEETRVMKAINSLSKKGNRAMRASLETEKNRITAIRAKIFPEGEPQERVINFSELYLMYGDDFLKTIKSIAHPLEQKMKIVLGS